MNRRRNLEWPPGGLPPLLLLALIASLLLFSSAGCKSTSHTSDSHLKKIDQMLNAQLHKGATRGQVEFFLNSRGYRIQDSSDKNAVVAIVRHIDTETLQPVTARVTFHFDSNNKMLSYELQAAPDTPMQP
ncbi:MAG: hypothetical protein WCE61_19415 [Candidatus Acidiferrum sp.]